MEFYGKRESQLMAAVAIVLMMIHHYFGFRGWLVEGSEWTPIVAYHTIIERTLSGYGFICIAIFAFSSGYVLYRRSGDYRYGRRLFLRLARFMIGYWMCLAVLYIAAVAFDAPLPGWRDLGLNMIGLECAPAKPWVNAPFAWYVTYYAVYLMITPPLVRAFSTKYPVVDIALYLLVTLVYVPLSNDWIFYPLSFSMAGIIAAKYDIVNRFGGWLSRRHVAVPIAISVATVIVRDKSCFLPRGLWLVLESLLTVALICSVVVIVSRLKSRFPRWGRWLEAAMLFVGGLSMPLWFLHGAFFTQLPLQWLLYAPHLSVIVVAWSLLILIPAAWLVKRLSACRLSPQL